MRLSARQVLTIKETVSSVLGDESAQITLFGSRVDDAARGGDIDLLINTAFKQGNMASMASRIMAGLQIKLGDKHIDILLVDPETALLPIHEHAKTQGVVL